MMQHADDLSQLVGFVGSLVLVFVGIPVAFIALYVVSEAVRGFVDWLEGLQRLTGVNDGDDGSN